MRHVNLLLVAAEPVDREQGVDGRAQKNSTPINRNSGSRIGTVKRST